MTRVVRRRAASSARTQKVSLKECQAFKHSRGGCMWRPAAQVRAGCARDENESEQCRGQTRDGYDRQTDSDGCGPIDSTYKTRGQERARRRGQERARREGQTIDSRRGQERARRRQSAQSVQCNSHQAGKQPWTAVVRGEAALLSSVLFEFN